MPDKSRQDPKYAGNAAAPARPTIDARQLAWWAESAFGEENEPVCVAVRFGGSTPELLPVSALDPLDSVLFDVEPIKREVTMTRPEKVSIKPPTGPEVDLTKGSYDALFWTASAVEKFVLPYYYAQRLLTAEDMAKLVAAYQSANIVAIAHMAPSKPIPIVDPFHVVASEAPHAPKSLIDFVRSR